MSKRGNVVLGYLLAFILVVLVVYFFSSAIVPKIGGLIEAVAWFKSDDTKNINQEKPTDNKLKINGELGEIKMLNYPYVSSPNYCSISTKVKNTGNTKWTNSDKIRITLFCKQSESEKSHINNFPRSGYFTEFITDFKPGDEQAVVFEGNNHCLKSAEPYKVVLYSNCEGNGNEYKPCDNLKDGYEPCKAGQVIEPKEIDCEEFKCPK